MLPSIDNTELNARIDALSDSTTMFVGSLAKESERSVVVMGVAKIDSTLERLLKSLFQFNPEGKDNLFDTDRPLNSFGTKIALAHRIGIIDTDLEQALRMFQKIRNDFAHSTQHETLVSPRHSDKLNVIMKVVKSSKSFAKTRDIFGHIVPSQEVADFTTAVDLTIILLECSMLVNTRLAPDRKATFTEL